MSNYNFDEEISRLGTSSVKWEYMWQGSNLVYGDWADPKHGKENRILPLWVADMDFRCPQVVLDAMIERTHHGIFGYTMEPDSYFQSFIDWAKTYYDWDVEKEWIKLMPGVVPALNMIVQTYTQPGDNVLVQGPVYYHFMNSANNHGRIPLHNNLQYDVDTQRYTMEFEDLAAKAADPRTTLAILCSPHNPVGRVWTADELKRFGEICLENDVLVVSDEIHADLIFDGHTFVPYANLAPGFEQNCIVCTAPSKTFNLAGLKTSNIVIPNKKLREKFEGAIQQSGMFGGNTLGLVAAEAAYTKGRPWLDAAMRYMQDNYAFMCDYIEQNIPQMKVVPCEGTYLVWVDCRGMGLTAAERKKLILEDAKVYLDDGPMFGPEGEAFERFNLACPRHILAESLERIRNQLA